MPKQQNKTSCSFAVLRTVSLIAFCFSGVTANIQLASLGRFQSNLLGTKILENKLLCTATAQHTP